MKNFMKELVKITVQTLVITPVSVFGMLLGLSVWGAAVDKFKEKVNKIKKQEQEA